MASLHLGVVAIEKGAIGWPSSTVIQIIYVYVCVTKESMLKSVKNMKLIVTFVFPMSFFGQHHNIFFFLLLDILTFVVFNPGLS